MTITLKWKVNASIGSTWMGPLAADLNNDGLMEIVLTARYGIAVLDPIDGHVIWSQPYGGDHVPCEIIDLNKDGIPEILMGPQYINGSSGGVLALHGNNGSVYWYNKQAACKGTYIAVADINADGYPEIYSALPGRITALTYDGRVFASTYTYYPCWGGLTIGDTDFDGIFEVYLGERSESYPSYPSGGRGLRAFWANNLTEIWAHPDILCSSQAPVLADVDKDRDLEIIILHQRGGIAVINTDGSVNTYKRVYRKQLSISSLPNGHDNPPVADLDGDGNLELITCSNANHNPTQPKIWDLVDWRLDATLPFPCMHPPGLADVDGDGKWEILDCNPKNVTIFKYNLDTKKYDIIGTINVANAHSFFIAQDIDADGKLELVFNEHNSWVSVWDVEAPAPTPLPRSGLSFYSQYRTRVPEYVPPPEQPPRISVISPKDGATNIPVSPLELKFKLIDFQNDLMNYIITTNPDIGSASDTDVPSGTIITVPVSGLTSSTTYTWNVTVIDGNYTTTRIFTFYTEGTVTLTVNISPEGSGSVIKNPESVDNVYIYGTRVKLTAVADNIIYKFLSWDGDLRWMGSNNPAIILMDGNKIVAAKFTKIQYKLTITISPTGSGNVICNPAGPYYYGDVVELTAVPNAGWSFSNWMGDLSGSQNPVTIIIDGNKKVTAAFTETPTQHELIISVSGNGITIPAPGSYLYNEGITVSVTAIPDSGWTFDHWMLDNTNVGSNNPYNVTMNNNHILEAVFLEIPPPPQYELVISVLGSGTTNPAPGTYIYEAGTEVIITAIPDSGWALDHWILDNVDAGNANPYTIILDSNHALEAVFTKVISPVQYQLTISILGDGVTNPAEGSYMYSEGTIVLVIAYPESGWILDRWLLDTVDVGHANPYAVTMDGNHTLTAVFVREQYMLTVNVSPEGSGIVALNNTGPYYHGDAVQLTAEPNTGWHFSYWKEGGKILGDQNPTVIIMDGNKNVTAVFTQEASQWWSPYWQYRRTITVNHTKVAGELADFPILIEIINSSLAEKAQPDGDDFVFIDENNMKLDHQIELYDNVTGHLIAWVKVPHLSSTTDTILYLYYGNPNCESQQNPSGVWDSSYMLVLHLNEQTGIQYDSTENGNNGTPLNGVFQGASGQIDGADTFDGSNDYIRVPHSDTLTGYMEAFTASFWIKIEDTSRRQTILCKYNTNGNMRGWQIEYDPTWQRPFWLFASENGVTYSEWWASWESFKPEANTWYHLTVVWEANAIPRFYVNGVQVPTVGTGKISSIFNNIGIPLYIGRSVYSTRFFKGSLDEIVILNRALSADWIFTEYNNQLNPTAFYTLGPEEQFV